MSGSPFLDWWRLAEISGSWAAAFGTFYAARMALSIARQQDQQLIKITAAEMLSIEGGNTQNIILIRVTNVARRPVTVTHLVWKFSWLSKFSAIQTVWPPNRALPYTLADGASEVVTLPVSRPEQANWYDYLAKVFLKFGDLRREYEIRSLRIAAISSTGAEFSAHPDKSFITGLRTAVDELKRQDP